MSTQHRKAINPQLLTLSRQVRRITQSQLATSIGVPQGTISKIEAGIIGVTDAELERIAETLDFPVTFFLRERRVEGPGLTEIYHNRKRRKASIGLLNCAYATATVLEMHVEDLLRSWQMDFEDFPAFPTDEFGRDAMKVARTVRAYWRLPTGAIMNLTGVIEDAGGIIMPCDFGTRFIFGFSRARKTLPPLFYLNRGLLPDQWRWTLAHELGHVVMHTDSDPYDAIELDADTFAGEFLMPTQEIKPQLLGLTFQKLAGLKRLWKVSMQAILMHAHRIEAISDRQRRYMFMQLTKAGYRMREPEALDPPVEQPKLLGEIVGYHRHQLGYSDGDLQSLLAINENDFHSFYSSPKDRLRVVG